MLSMSLTYYLCVFIQLLYPSYASLKAIQSDDKFDDTQWLTYWVVYAVISTMESVGEIILQWVPLYYEIKLVFVVWMIVPQTQGARVIYERYIVPWLQKYGPKIDPIFNRTEDALKSSYVNKMASMVDKYGPDIAESALKTATEHAKKFGAAAATAANNYQQQQAQLAAGEVRKDI